LTINLNATNSKQAQTLKSYFETTITLKQNNINFGVKICLKSRAVRLLANRCGQVGTNTFELEVIE